MAKGMKINVQGLEQLLKALKAKPPVGRVGILGDRNQRTGSEKSNAEIGAFHEFGTSRLPVRSFLRVPLIDHLDKRLKASGAFDESVLARIVAEGTFRPWVQLMTLEAEGVVLDAFATGGFGKWPPSDMTHKKVKQTLVETQQLRNSITSDVQD